MRVLHFYRTYFPDSQGGLEEVIRQICQSSTAHGVESRVLSLSRTPASEPVQRNECLLFQAKMDFEIASCSIGLFAGKIYQPLLDWADVVHLHYPWPYSDLLHLIYSSNKPTVLTYHSDVVRQRFLRALYKPLEYSYLNSVNEIVATSETYKNTSKNLKKYAAKTSVIPIGIDELTYPVPSADKLAQVKDTYGEDFFLFVGMLRYYKGLDTLISAAQGLSKQVFIVGKGPEELSLRNQIKRLGCDNVELLGFVDDETKMALYKLSRCVVLPSHLRSEAYGVSLVEGAMMSKPLISADVGSGTTFVNIHQQTGIVVKPKCVQSLTNALQRLAEDDQLVDEYGINARRHFETEMTAEKMGRRYVQLYEKLIENHA